MSCYMVGVLCGCLSGKHIPTHSNSFELETCTPNTTLQPQGTAPGGHSASSAPTHPGTHLRRGTRWRTALAAAGRGVRATHPPASLGRPGTQPAAPAPSAAARGPGWRCRRAPVAVTGGAGKDRGGRRAGVRGGATWGIAERGQALLPAGGAIQWRWRHQLGSTVAAAASQTRRARASPHSPPP